MALEEATATDLFDLFDRLRTFLTATMTPAGERWVQERWTGYEALHFSSELGSFEAFRAFDADAASSWRTALGAATPSHLGVKLVQAVDIRFFAITAPTAELTMAPDSFALEYSDDGAAWTTLESFTSPGAWASQERRQFTVTAGSPGARLWWRVRVTANKGHADHTSIASLELLTQIASSFLNHALEPQLILRGPGLAAADSIYVGVQRYSLPTSDIFNWRIAGFTGYVASNSFATQPGASGMVGVPLWDQSTPYWLIASGRRFALVAKVETTYQMLYLGHILPYATPGQWPYPLMVAGMLASDSVTRFSDASIEMPWRATASGALRVRDASGAWLQLESWPWENAASMRDILGDYALLPILLTNAVGTGNVYGEVDGLYQVSGFGNAVENIVQAGGVDHLVVQNVFRTGIRDYYALAKA